MEERYIAAVDLGSSKIALTVARISGEDIQILYYKERPSDGIRNSAVFNPQKASVPIREAVEEAQQELNIKIMQVVVSLPRCEVRQEIAQASVERNNPDESITAEEVDSLKRLAQDSYPLTDPEKEELYGAIAQSFSDDENFQLIENDIIGVISRNFEGNFKLFIGKKRAVETIDKVFNNLGIAIARKYFSPGSIAKAVLTTDEMENGVALIDFGGGATSVTIYKGKILRYYASIPFGGKVITSDIRSECTISETLAENIKLAYGACMPDRLQNLEEKIIQIEGDEMEGYKQIPVKYLSEIITARTREIIDAILYQIQESNLADSLRSGVVVTGGGAELTNLCHFIKELSGYNVRQGYPRHLFSASGCEGAYGCAASNSIGMILEAKADGLLNCIEAPEFRMQGFGIEMETPVSEEAPEPAYEEETYAADPQPSDSLFTEEEVPKEEKARKPKKVKEPKEPKEHKPFISITWKSKVQKLFGNIYEGVGSFYDNVGNDDEEV